MQRITSVSKYILLLILSCSFLIVWDSDNTIELVSTPQIAQQKMPRTETPGTVWNDMRRDFNLDLNVESAQVQKEIRRLVADQGKLYQILQAAGPYIYFIHKQTEARGLPAELALIPVIESEFNPNDHSNKGATGLWQLMSGTAHELGIKVMSNYDGRRNVIASTKAALAYFNDLGTMFNGNWYLAIAAYNCGQGRVMSAERRAGSHTFWNLPLPQETKYYVPRLLAVAEIVKNPEKYGVQLPPVSNQPYFTEMKINKSVNLTEVAKSSGININTLQTLNPDYNHGNQVPKKVTTTLLVPINKVPVVKEKMAKILSV